MNIDEAVKIAKKEHKDEDYDMWEVNGFIGALIGVDSSLVLGMGQRSSYKKGHDKGNEYLTVLQNSECSL